MHTFNDWPMGTSQLVLQQVRCATRARRLRRRPQTQPDSSTSIFHLGQLYNQLNAMWAIGVCVSCWANNPLGACQVTLHFNFEHLLQSCLCLCPHHAAQCRHVRVTYRPLLSDITYFQPVLQVKPAIKQRTGNTMQMCSYSRVSQCGKFINCRDFNRIHMLSSPRRLVASNSRVDSWEPFRDVSDNNAFALASLP